MKEIPLTRGHVARVDDEDYDALRQYRWHTQKDKTGLYAARKTWNKDTRMRGVVRMHRQILCAVNGQWVDHKDGDGLNNRRDNLRFATPQENGRNRKKSVKNTSGFKGVYWRTGKSPAWVASIRDGIKHVGLGSHDTAEAAGRAYDQAAMELYGEFARLNFPIDTLAPITLAEAAPKEVVN